MLMTASTMVMAMTTTTITIRSSSASSSSSPSSSSSVAQSWLRRCGVVALRCPAPVRLALPSRLLASRSRQVGWRVDRGLRLQEYGALFMAACSLAVLCGRRPPVRPRRPPTRIGAPLLCRGGSAGN